jgi:hypothetical protein
VVADGIDRPFGQDSAGVRHPVAAGRSGVTVMTPHMKIGILGVVVGLILFLVSPWLALAVIALAIAIPGVAYAMLDSNQKARLKQIRSRRQIGR